MSPSAPPQSGLEGRIVISQGWKPLDTEFLSRSAKAPEGRSFVNGKLRV
jgi:hypothetical protein